MSFHIEGSNAFKIGLLKDQGGYISCNRFNRLIAQLRKTRSLDHINPQLLAALPANLGEFDVIYIILRRGHKSDLDEHGNLLYTHIGRIGVSRYWLAGFASLIFPAYGHQQTGDSRLSGAADISIALLPEAQRYGHGRLVVQRLVQHAFTTLDILRVTASVICPIQPSHPTATKKQVLYNAKQLCWIFEKFGFKFEGISRGAVMGTRTPKGEDVVWYDVHRLSMLQTDYFDKKTSDYLWNRVPQSPWESMLQRQEEEKRDLESWKKEVQGVSANDACNSDDEGSDEETILGGDSGSDQEWDITNDFDD